MRSEAGELGKVIEQLIKSLDEAIQDAQTAGMGAIAFKLRLARERAVAELREIKKSGT
jgi:hypothetical protein